MKEPKQPKLPRCWFQSNLRRALGIVSPTLAFTVRNEETDKYFNEMSVYVDKLAEYKIEKRICTKEEYKLYCRRKRTRGK